MLRVSFFRAADDHHRHKWKDLVEYCHVEAIKAELSWDLTCWATTDASVQGQSRCERCGAMWGEGEVVLLYPLEREDNCDEFTCILGIASLTPA